MSATYATSDENVTLAESMEFKNPRKVVCALSKLTLGLLVLSVVVIVVLTAVTTYFVTKDAYDDDIIIGGTTTNAPATTTTPIEVTEEPLPTGLRLNKTLIPIHYNVELQPYIYDGDDFSFDGNVKLWFRCNETTPVITLHADTLVIDENTIELIEENSQTSIELSNWEEDKPRQFLKLYPKTELESGGEFMYSLSMNFTGTLIHDYLYGFYRSKYEENGETRYLATTQFQRSHARRAFPCFDEPSFKATFNITLLRKDFPYSTISNMPIMRTENRGSDWYADVYAQTVVMSPYLLAFVVSDFISKTYTTPNGTKFNIWARTPYIDSVDYALNISGAIMEAFEDYTNIPFVLPETDEIAIPDFAAGAMENWGLITYRETALLYNPDFSTTADKQYVARVIAHELAHMWFGNLVTCDWWDDTWLNEGFATYFANVGVDLATQDWDTQWQMWFGNLVTCDWWDDTWLNEGFATYFEYHIGVDGVQQGWKVREYFLIAMWGIMVTDGNSDSQPVHVKDLEHHSELGRAFSSITYQKGGSVIRMMRYFLGEETFRKGLERYLKSHEFSTVVRDDLYQALQEQAEEDGAVNWDMSKRNLSSIMDTWIIQQNYPLLKLTVNPVAETLTVEQSHFLYDTNATLSEESPFGEYIWDIFLTLADGNLFSVDDDDYHRQWIYRDRSISINYNGSSWMVANIFHQGFFRTWYDDQTNDAILNLLKTNHTALPVENRGQIVDDAFNLARAGIVDEVRALRTLEYMTDEREYLPWYTAMRTRLPYIKRMLYSTKAFADLQAFLMSIIEPTYIEIGWDNENSDEHLQKYLRQLVINEACELRNSDCLQKASELYAQVMTAADFLENIVSPDLRSTIYCTAIRNGGIDEWDHALARYHYNYTIYIANEKRTLLNALSCTREQWIQTMYLEMGMQINQTEPFTNMASKEGSQTVVWQFMEERWNDLPSGIDKSQVITVLTDWMSTTYHLEQLKNFFSKVGSDEESGISITEQEALINKVNHNVRWLADNEEDITAWLQNVNLV